MLSLESSGEEELSIDTIVARAEVRRGHARKLAHDLVRKGWIQRLGDGRYLLNPGRHGPDAVPDTDPFRLGAHLVRPYYFGYASAAELWGLLLQAGHVYYLVTPTRTAVRPDHAAQYRFVRVRRERFFGRVVLSRRGERIWVSDRERTLLDCLARPELAGGLPGVVQVLARAGPGLRWDRLSRYLDRLGTPSLGRRLGFLADRLGLTVPAGWRRRWRARADDPWTPLGPPSEFARAGPHEPEWHVVRNVPDRFLLAEVGHP